MNENSKTTSFFLGLGVGALVGLLFDLSQRRSSELAFQEGWLLACSTPGPRLVRPREGLR